MLLRAPSKFSSEQILDFEKSGLDFHQNFTERSCGYKHKICLFVCVFVSDAKSLDAKT